MRVIFLSITSWGGISPDAFHYYGKLKTYSSEDDIELLHPLSKREVIELNKKLEEYDEYHYHPGELYRGFWSKEKLIDYAIKSYKNYFPMAQILLLGDTYIAEPQLPLDGVLWLVTAIKEAYELNEKKYNPKVCDLYWKLIQELEPEYFTQKKVAN